MNKLLALAALAAFIWFLMWLNEGAQARRAAEAASNPPPAAAPVPTGPTISGTDLPGMPAAFEESLRAAQAGGHEGLAAWLKRYRPSIQDPRLAWIELDYVVLLNLKDRAAAVREFQRLKQRLPPDIDPRITDRLAALARTYE
jgi:hypothetical protein